MLIEGTKMDWETLYCPNKRCRYYSIPFRQGKMVKNGTSYVQPQPLCKGCGCSVALSYTTAYYGLESDPAIFETAVGALTEGNSICTAGRILQIDKNTICEWLDRVALHYRSVVLYLWSRLHVTEC
jgi:transposase-like protein